jgi:hypothetical protein
MDDIKGVGNRGTISGSYGTRNDVIHVGSMVYIDGHGTLPGGGTFPIVKTGLSITYQDGNYDLIKNTIDKPLSFTIGTPGKTLKLIDLPTDTTEPGTVYIGPGGQLMIKLAE